MKIFFDCTYLRNTHTGVDVYFLSLIPQILKLDYKNQYTILIDSRYNSDYLVSQIKDYRNYNIIKIYSPFPLQVLYSSLLIPFYLLIKRFKIYHNPYFFGPLLKFICPNTKVVITVHDLYHKTVPEMMNKKLNIVFNFFANNAIKFADEIIVISNQTKADVIKYLNINPNKLSLIYQALNQKFANNDEIKSEVITINDRYILTVGKLLPSKGISDLIKAYVILVKKYKEANIKLISVGMFAGSYVNYIKELITESQIDKDLIKFSGYVTDDELKKLYRNACFIVVPSHYEGFGLPILEAMKFGKPVIVRNASSLTEIIADAGLLFNDCNELAEKMHLLLHNDELKGELIDKGYRRLKDFSWETTAKNTVAVYKKITLT